MRFIYILYLAMLSASVHAQLKKGMKQLGGAFSASYNTNKYDNGTIFLNNDRDISTFIIRPEIGFFVKDNFSLAFGLSYGINTIMDLLYLNGHKDKSVFII